MKKILLSISLIFSFAQVWASDTYNPVNGQLTIPIVRVGSTNYTNVVITVGKVLSVGTNPTPYAVDFYQAATNQLIIPIVNVGSNTFNNVVVNVGSVISIGGQMPTGSPSSIVQASSYLNAKNIGIGPQTIPMNVIPQHPNMPELINGGPYAFGDFFQDGTLAMIAASGIYGGYNGYSTTLPGKLYFFHSDGKGGWLDQTTKLLDNQRGCITSSIPLVADFNGDGKPDVFIPCIGVDGAIPQGYSYGENQRVLLSQKDGTYKNIDTGINCYCHRASAAELNKKGYADIAVVDPQVNHQPYFLINNGNGTFTPDYSRMPASTLPYYFPGSTVAHGTNIYEIELLDLNNDGKFDLFLNGAEVGAQGVCTEWSFCSYPSNIFINDGSNIFTNSTPKTIPKDSVYSSVLDLVFIQNILYLMRVGDYKGTRIQKVTYPELKATDIYTTPANFIYSNNTTYIDQIRPYNGNIVSTNTAYDVNVPQ